MPLPAVLDEPGHQGGRDRLPADRLALLPQQDQALVRVEILRTQRERAAAAAGGLRVQPQQQRVQLRVIARGRGGLVDLRQSGVRQRPPGGRQAARLGHLARRVVRLGDQPVIHRALVQAAQRGHQMLLGAAPAAGVAAGHDVGLDVGHQLPDLRRRRLVQPPAAPVLDDPVPVRPVRPPGPGAHRRRHHRDVLGEGRHRLARLRDGGQVGRGQAHPLQQHQRRLHHRLPGGLRVHRGHGRLPSPGTGACARSAWSTTANEYAVSVSSPGEAASST